MSLQTSAFELPAIVYHGTFKVESMPMEELLVHCGSEYLSTTPIYALADYFAQVRRWRFRDSPGSLIRFQIETASLPKDCLESCIPPDGIHPRAGPKTRKYWGRSLPDRMLMKEWRFLGIPPESLGDYSIQILPANSSFILPLLPYRLNGR